MVYKEPKQRTDFLPLVLYLSHVNTHLNRGHTFSLVYGVEEMVFIEVMVPSARIVLSSKLEDSHDRIRDMQAFNERMHNVENTRLSYQKG